MILIDKLGCKIEAMNEVNTANTLDSADSKHPQVVCYGISAYNSNCMKSSNPHSGIYEAKTSRTLDLNGGNPSCNQGGMIVVYDGQSCASNTETAYTIQASRADDHHISVVCVLNDQGGAVMDVSDKAGTLRAQEHMHQPIICFKERAGKPGGGKGILIGEDRTFTLSTIQQDTICYSVENHPNDSRVKIREDGTVQTLSARCGTGGGTPHAHSYVATQYAGYKETLPTLRASGGDLGGGSEGLICMKTYPKATGALCANSHPRSCTEQDGFNDMQPVIENYTGGVSQQRLTQVTGKEREQEMERNESSSASAGKKYILRRLTPTECARLQGFPDWWTDGADGSDSAKYKLWGNGIALPCAFDVLSRIAKELRRDGK